MTDHPQNIQPFLDRLNGVVHLTTLSAVRVGDGPDTLLLDFTVEVMGEPVDPPEEDRTDEDFTLEEAQALLDDCAQEGDEDDFENPVFPTETWRVEARGVTDHALRLGEVEVSVRPDSPRLVRARLPVTQLMYASAPTSRERLLAALWAVHDPAVWGPFGGYGLGGDLTFGSGVFAVGPQPLMERYAEVLCAHFMRPSFLPLLDDVSGPPPQVCLELRAPQEAGVPGPDLFVLADSLHASLIGKSEPEEATP